MSSLTLQFPIGSVPVTAPSVKAFGAMWRELQPSIKRFSKIISKDKNLRKELVQEAMIALWAADPTRYSSRIRSDVSELNRRLIFRMWEYSEAVTGESKDRVDAIMSELVNKASSRSPASEFTAGDLPVLGPPS